ncbi:uncharacterized protein LOC120516651 [Polypterus senegalus]|uniref:uncharacterized protein LOC120516651 n=1 Tax=Polypterus senegalus TaxID=55291 RepID=UPI0019652F58|nr:uncharacterized protein LOC120516651 [Polypterus senegalus]XP_039594402.1 uncharacterized protein LOC120516651 [Polypterus senegalus]
MQDGRPVVTQMSGYYLGTAGSPLMRRRTGAAGIYRRGRCRVQTVAETQRYNKIELLRVREPDRILCAAQVQPKNIREEQNKCPLLPLPPPRSQKRTPQSLEELRRLTSQILKEYAHSSGRGVSSEDSSCRRLINRSSTGSSQMKISGGSYCYPVAKTQQVQYLQGDEYKRLTRGFHDAISIRNLQTHREHREPQSKSCSSLPSLACPVSSRAAGTSPVCGKTAPHEHQGHVDNRFLGNKKTRSIALGPLCLISRSLQLKQRASEHEDTPRASDPLTDENSLKLEKSSKPKDESATSSKEQSGLELGIVAAKDSALSAQSVENEGQPGDIPSEMENKKMSQAPTKQIEVIIELKTDGDSGNDK